MHKINSGRRCCELLASAVAGMVTLAMVIVAGLAFRGSAFATETVELGGEGTHTSINNVNLQKCSGGGYDWCHSSNSSWSEVSGLIKGTDTLRFTLNYTLERGVLSQQNNTLSYQLPEVIKPHKSEQGTILDARNNALGTFTIDTNGLITITYNKDAITANNNSEMVGDLVFDIAARDIHTDDDNTVKFDFGDENTIVVAKQSDIQITKTADYNKTDPAGLITYTLNISSVNGTGGPVSIADDITYSTVPVHIDSNSFAVNPEQNGWQAQVGADGKSFTIANLPQLNRDSSYTVTYTAHADLPSDGFQYAHVRNEATASSVDQNNSKISDSANCEATFYSNDSSLWKSGYLQDDGSIQWAINVNPGDKNLAGLTLTDVITGSTLPDTATIIPDPSTGEGSASISFTNGTYTFPAATKNKPYVITYTTPKSVSGVDTVSNTVSDNRGHTAISEVDVHVKNRLVKDDNGYKVNSGGSNATYMLHWNSKIEGSNGQGMALDISGPWTFTDTLKQPVEGKVTHYFTAVQQEEIKQAVNEHKWALGDDATVTFTQTGDYVTGFIITGSKTITASTWVDLKYDSTAVVENNTITSFENKASISQYEDSASITVNPNDSTGSTTIIKKDARRGTSDDTEHDMNNDLDSVCVPEDESGIADTQCNAEGYTAKANVLHWQLEINTTDENIKNGLQIIENLPEGTSFLEDGRDYYSSQQQRTGLMAKNDSVALNLNGSTQVSGNDGRPHTWNVETSGSKAVITVPKDWSDKEFTIDVRALIDDDAAWTRVTPSENKSSIKEKFVAPNTASVNRLDGTQIAEDTQIQTITRTHMVVEKTGGLADGLNNNTMQYSIKINADGLDLLEDGDDLTLTDVLTYGYWTNNGLSTVYYVPDSLHVYNMAADGKPTGEPLTNITYTYTNKCTPGQNLWDEVRCARTLTMHVPDKKPLIVKYQYKYSNEKDGISIGITNNADLYGYSSSSGEQWHANQSGSSSLNATGLTVVKTDANDFGKYLEGATFDLFKYICANDAAKADDNACWTKVEGENTPQASNAKGEVSLTHLTPNTAYKLVETSAPSGYKKATEPKYFLMSGDGSTSTVKPSDVEVTSYNPGDHFFFGNVRLPRRPRLPRAGGAGTQPLAGVGAALVVVASLGLTAMGRRTNHRRLRHLR